jgi:TetR/AcrR family transcriptional repressor of nem operon
MAVRKAAPSKSERTRRRIMNAATAAYRQRGIDGVGVRDIMKRAGLTQGGFYFHFPDKEALFNEASRDAATALAGAYVGIVESAPAGKKLKAFIDAYLSAEHRDHPESGCMMSALGSELARSDRKLRVAFTKTTAIILDKLAPYFPGATSAERFQRAGLLLASMAGVLMVSRVLSDPARSDALLARARQFFSASFTDV